MAMLFQPMDEAHFESSDIAIRCPGCSQRFKVGPELQGRMVECGSCDQRFRVDDEVTVRQKKVYPGERKGTSLNRFSRVPTKSSGTPAFQSINYEKKAPDPVSVEPTSPFRTIMGIVAVVGAILVALILVFGGNPGGMLDGASLGKRLILSSFTAILTLILLFVANPHGRVKAGLIGTLFAGGLLALPFLFKQGTSKKVLADFNEPPVFGEETSEPMVVDPLSVLKDEMHYEPLAEALEAYGPDGVTQGKTAIGIWLRDLRDFNKYQVIEYLTQATEASDASWLYPRPPDDFLMVLIDVEDDLEGIAKLCERFGRPNRIIPELNVVEVKVMNEAFVQGSMEKLTNPENPSFYELNRRELESIDSRRVEDAVKRLAVAEPKVYRKDIVRRMQDLFGLADTEMKSDLAAALSVWAENGDGSVEIIREATKELMEAEGEVPRSMVAFMVQNRDGEVIPLLDEIWAEEPGTWESLYGEMGPSIEARVLRRFENGSPILKISAANLLAKVGSAMSLPALRKEQKGSRSEMAVVLARAIEAIESRQ